jgi:phosphoglycerol geranylgeranyltransferase
MRYTIYRKILLNREARKKMFAVLIDPEKSCGRNLASVVAALKVATPDFIFIGGSHLVRSTESLIEILKEELSSEILLFPGDASHFAPNADALLYLSLLSGRNPDYLIGQHVKSSVAIMNSGIEVIPTAYLVIDGGKTSSVEYISNTCAIPRDKKEIALSTVLAGELLGMRLTYLEAGSGAAIPVPAEMITHVRLNSNTPLIVGGGIVSLSDLNVAYEAGADIVVVGNVFENKPNRIIEFVEWVNQYNNRKANEKMTHSDILT